MYTNLIAMLSSNVCKILAKYLGRPPRSVHSYLLERHLSATVVTSHCRTLVNTSVCIGRVTGGDGGGRDWVGCKGGEEADRLSVTCHIHTFCIIVTFMYSETSNLHNVFS